MVLIVVIIGLAACTCIRENQIFRGGGGADQFLGGANPPPLQW